jgi:adenosylcobinamide-GDP ribazoletransferase
MYLPLCVFVAEVGAKQAMITIATFGKAIHEGLGSMVIDHTTFTTFLIGFVMGGVACTLALGIAGMIAFIAAIASSFCVLAVAKRHFNGINGDCIGTANEVGRIVSLIAVIMVLTATAAGYGGLAWMPL